MKNLFLTLITLLYFQNNYSQIYYSNYLDQTSEWKDLFIDNSYSVRHTVYQKTIFFNGFEDFNGYSYYKVYETLNYTTYDYSYENIIYPQSADETIFVGYLRENPQGQFIWYRYNHNTNTYFDSVDFDNQIIINRNIGDNYSTFTDCSIATLSTVNIAGESRKVIMSGSDFTSGGSAIEGVGDISRLCLNAYVVDWAGAGRIMCYTKQNQTTSFFNNYTLGTSGIFAVSCNSFPPANRTGLAKNQFSISDLNVYPNPTNNFINIDFRNQQNSFNKISIFNVLGKNVYTNNLNPLDLNSIDLSALNKGCYFAKLESESQSTTIKIIKN